MSSKKTCSDGFQSYLPLAASRGRWILPHEAEDGVAPENLAAGGQLFYLIHGGQIRIPSTGRETQYCLDVHDVWDSQFTTGHGGPEPGQRVQAFRCIDTQLNQRWNVTGDIMSVGKCLALSGNTARNGAPARVQNCNGSADQDWDYYW